MIAENCTSNTSGTEQLHKIKFQKPYKSGILIELLSKDTIAPKMKPIHELHEQSLNHCLRFLENFEQVL